MTSLNQIIKKSRIKKLRVSKTIGLQKCPQKKGICLSVFERAPKKPNSASRKVTKVRISNKNIVLCSIPGEGHNLQEHSNVLVRGGRVKDLPGVRYKVIRGCLDSQTVVGRRRRRSKYGTPKS